MMKRFMVFSQDAFYPSGGMNDYVGAAADLDVAMLAALRATGEHKHIAEFQPDKGLVVVWDSQNGIRKLDS